MRKDLLKLNIAVMFISAKNYPSKILKNSSLSTRKFVHLK